jgi:diaminohydroxyphosphoribosylaminopyrimidine deaminase/5-amino-6-(5-phosphoribosylamino)uracil reductase
MQESKEQQQFFMKWALSLGEKGRLSAPPNPWVGCVIVKAGEIVGEGYHVRPGQPHAEKVALEQAGARARDATLYVTLEPCCHENKRTPPCHEAILKAGIKRVFIAIQDSDPHVNGKGISALKENGVHVEVGLCAQEAKNSLAPYLFQRQHKRPYVVLKAAVSLDGKVALKDGSSKWLTGEEARKDAHLLRAESGAILVGTRTALLDKPLLTVRSLKVDKQPLRVILDASGKLSGDFPFLNTAEGPTLIVTTSQCPPHVLEEWRKKNVEFEIQTGPTIDLESLLHTLYQRAIVQLLVEGGPQTQHNFLEQNLANKMVLYKAPCLLGNDALPFLPIENPQSMDQIKRFQLESVQRFEQDIRLNFLLS